MTYKMKLTCEQLLQLKEAVYKISDARFMLIELNNQMKSDHNWKGQADIAAVCENLNELCKKNAGGIGSYLKIL